MPKKFKGENSKAVEAKARKDAVRQAEKDKKQKEVEDEYWRDDDKHVNKKLQRKEDKEKKKIDQVEKKQELKKMAEEEMTSIKTVKPQRTVPAKVTRYQAGLNKEQIAASEVAARMPTQELDDEDDLPPIVENVNRLQIEGEEARTVEEALSVLGSGEKAIDMHPEKRVKAAYAAFEDEHLPRLKKENPNLRLSQLKQMLKKDWMKSPQNPLNQQRMQMSGHF